MNNLQEALNNYITNPENPEYNWSLAQIYENIGQTAAALSYYIRTAERSDDDLLTYESLMRAAICYDKQGSRSLSVRGLLQHAISICPTRPEAYLKLSILSETNTHWAGHWFDAYTYASIGWNHADKIHRSLRTDVDYPGAYALLFQKAHTSWWCGMCDQARDIFLKLYSSYTMPDSYKQLVKNNLINLGVIKKETPFNRYSKDKSAKLLHQFPGCEAIDTNYSEAYQDMFVLCATNGKTDGSYLEIGAGDPFYGNNTALLEMLGWRGVSIDLNPRFADAHNTSRRNRCANQDAIQTNYTMFADQNNLPEIIDYLQVDCDPAIVSFEVLKQVLQSNRRFRVVTFEHDHYMEHNSIREDARKLMEIHGYKLIVDNIAPDSDRAFEDWYIHPELVDSDIIAKLYRVDGSTKIAEEYMLSGNENKLFDWGPINNNKWFKSIVEREVFIDNVYEKFVAVKENDVVVDLGASVGPFAWLIKDRKPSKVVCVEPHKELFKTLSKNTSFNCLNRAIGDTNDKELQKGLFNENFVETQENDNIAEVDCITFKSLLDIYSIDRINFLKVDCEGGEYSVFTPENIDWIVKNVDYIVGEWHLSDPDLKAKFRTFRDTILPKFNNVEVYSFDDVNIKHDLHTDWFIEYYSTITIYIDNRQRKQPPAYTAQFSPKKTIKDKWKYSVAPTLEFTTIIPEKGCVVDCVFCPQRTLIKNYSGERRLSLDSFKRAVDKLPQEIRVTFAGFTEPWLNSDCTDMVLYAHEKGHPISVFTTLVGVSVEDLERIKHIPFAGAPNGGFIVHLPDQEKRAKHPITKKYIQTVEHLGKIHHSINNFSVMSMGTVHDDVKHVFPTAITGQMWSRAGNLIGERLLKPELRDQHFLSIDHGDKAMTCGCDERLYHNIMLPNGDVSLCCMDYGLEEITGNLFKQDYNDVIPDPYEVFKLCSSCENAVDVNSMFIQAEKRVYKL